MYKGCFMLCVSISYYINLILIEDQNAKTKVKIQTMFYGYVDIHMYNSVCIRRYRAILWRRLKQTHLLLHTTYNNPRFPWNSYEQTPSNKCFSDVCAYTPMYTTFCIPIYYFICCLSENSILYV